MTADTSIRDAYLAAAETIAPLLRDQAVVAAWDQPSALAEFSVRGLAGHLASQVFLVSAGLVTDSELDVVPVAEHYARVTWIGEPPDSDFNTLIRSNGELTAEVGVFQLAGELEAAVAEQRTALPAAAADHRVTAPSGLWSLWLDDFVLTRLMEVAVHSDDLAVSVGVDPPLLPDEVVMPVVALLAGVALRRHGQAALLRSLSRRERAPETIAAF